MNRDLPFISGDVVESAVFYLVHLGAKQWGADGRAEAILKSLASRSAGSPLVIAIGNGTASREVQRFVASLIQRHQLSAHFWLVLDFVTLVYNCF